jgi:hypothetical protein
MYEKEHPNVSPNAATGQASVYLTWRDGKIDEVESFIGGHGCRFNRTFVTTIQR